MGGSGVEFATYSNDGASVVDFLFQINNFKCYYDYCRNYHYRNNR
jgi:hypothetical protein